eukprot:11082462-Heterocapsa_arctica.AAC.1
MTRGVPKPFERQVQVADHVHGSARAHAESERDLTEKSLALNALGLDLASGRWSKRDIKLLPRTPRGARQRHPHQH